LIKLLFFYPYFTPAFKAGGPVRSIENMVAMLGDDFFIDIVCSAYDLGNKELLEGIVPDEWNSLSATVRVLYIQTAAARRITESITHGAPDCIYINGIFLPLYSWLPLWVASRNHIPVVLTPRGMLQKGAMANKSLKKNISIALMRALRFHTGILWQATDEQEKTDVHRYFGKDARVSVIGNLPKPPGAINPPRSKNSGELRLIFLSLIARKKNLDLVLKALTRIREPVTLDIYGPVKDERYWQECRRLMEGQIHSIRYLGPIKPADVQACVKDYHAFILMTKGENFGHAIYEALSVGTPAIISHYTPWGDLKNENAGITVEIEDLDSCVSAIATVQDIGQEDFDKLSQGAFKLANRYYQSGNFKERYTDMFLKATPGTRISSNKLSKVVA
jgi:glycosyltransferase involved in cell wall biosynthesis